MHVCICVSVCVCSSIRQSNRAKVVRLTECWASHPTKVAILLTTMSLSWKLWRSTVRTLVESEAIVTGSVLALSGKSRNDKGGGATFSSSVSIDKLIVKSSSLC